MFRRLLIALVLCLLPALAFGQISEIGKPVKVITDASIVGAVTFDSDTIYNIDGFVFVDAGETLTIEPGTIIKANTGSGVDASALIVSKGGHILAQGTAGAPIVFTSILDDLDDPNDIPYGDAGRGLWGGVLILGDAQLNTTAGVGNVEGLPASTRTEYGGSNDDDSSGVLSYVSIRHGGSVLGTANEINGLTLGAVGRGTKIDHIEIFQNIDDGIEFFGGTVNIKHAIVAFCGDDGFDHDEGYSGAVQFAFTIYDTEDADACGEHDGGTTPEDGTPYATPIYSNVTYLGSGYTVTTGKNTRAFTIRDNWSGAYYNSIFSDVGGFGLTIEALTVGNGGAEDSENRLREGSIQFQHNVWGRFQKGFTSLPLSNYEGWTDSIVFNGYGPQGDMQNELINPLIHVTRTATADNDPRPKNTTGFPAWTTPTAYDPPAKPGHGANFSSFFETVDYLGAFDPNVPMANSWIAGWTAFDFYGYMGDNDGQCELTEVGKPTRTITDASITGTVHLSRDTVYTLDGFVFVDSGEVLTIDPGTIIKANTGSGVDASALIVSKNGLISGYGEQCCPIVFTSIIDDVDDPNDIPFGDAGRGLWGGVLILGDARLNTTAGVGNVEGLPASTRTEYGGADDHDNSGVLSHVSIRHGGSVLGTANEINGLTLGAVGDGTSLNYIEIFQNIDDGIEFFGGTVNIKHAIIAFCGDDGFDHDEGYSGAIQYGFVIQEPEDADACGEHDGGTTPEDGTPYATPVYSNMTYLGVGASATTGKGTRAFTIRDNWSGAYFNSIFSDVAGFGLTIEALTVGGGGSEDSENRLREGSIQFQHNVWGDFTVGTGTLALSNSEGWTDSIIFLGQGPQGDMQNVVTSPGINVTRTATADNDPRPKNTAGFPAWTDPTAYNPPAKPNHGTKFVNFFDAVNYLGAFDPAIAPENSWLACWTAFDQYGFLGTNNSGGGCCIGGTGNINGDAQDNVDISDLTKLVNNLFVTFEAIPCPAEANTNGDAACNIDISDLTKLVNNLFVTFEPLAPCDPNCE